jgi:hypothetical protein
MSPFEALAAVRTNIARRGHIGQGWSVNGVTNRLSSL